MIVAVGRELPGVVSIGDRPTPGLGPLGGLNAALAWAAATGFDAVLTSACDLPDLPVDLLGRLGDAPAVARGQPLLGLWLATLAPVLDAHLASGERSVRSWVRRTAAREVDLGAVRNINTVADLAAG